MKKIILLLLAAVSLPLATMAQGVDDDLYYIPKKDKNKKEGKKEVVVPVDGKKQEVRTTIYTNPGSTVVVQDSKGNTRNIDEYNRRYDTKQNKFVMEDDTLYIKEKNRYDLDGEWVGGEFQGSQDDYEYAERIIRFRNPRYAVPISSPHYWDMVYGVNAWDWNVYTDGMYAYAFPTFSNRLWWDWRWGSVGMGWGSGWGYGGYGWNSWYGGHYGGYYGWGGYWPGYWSGGWGWGHHHHNHWGGGDYYPGGGGGHHWASRPVYNNNRRPTYAGGSSGRVSGTETSRRPTYSSSRVDGNTTNTSRRPVSTARPGATTGSRPSSGRVVGTRPLGTESSEVVTRPGGTSTSRRPSVYTRPSTSDGSGTSVGSGTGTSRRSSGSNITPRPSSGSSPTYSRGSSSSPRNYSPGNSSSRSSSSPSYAPSRSSSSSSYSSGGSSSGSSRSGGSSSSGGGSSRSSGSGTSRR